MDIEALEAGTEWEAYVRRENPPLWRSIEAQGYRVENLETELGHAVPLTVKLTGQTLYADPETIGERAGTIAERVDEDLDYFWTVAEDCRATCEAFLDACESIAAGPPPEERPDDRLSEEFRTYVDHNTEVVAYRELVFFLDEILRDLLDEATAEIADERGEPLAFTPDQAVPEEDLPFVAERRDLLELGRTIERDEAARAAFDADGPAAVLEALPADIRDRIAAHAEEYGWITTSRYTGDPLAPPDLVENLRPLLGTCDERLADLDATHDRTRERLDDLVAEHDRLADLVAIAREYAFLRTYRMDVVFEGDYRLRPFFEAIAARGGLSSSELIYLTVPEIEGILRGEPPSRRTIAARREAYAVYVDGNEVGVVEGDLAAALSLPDDPAAQQVGSEAVSRSPSSAVRLNGRVAHPGSATGPAALVFGDDDLPKVDEGDVLVSPMTTPDMTVALHDVAGIVTDEGGMASHAAIISREFGIPCVIGTGTATSLLQDGDQVVVDAEGDEGVVRLVRDV